MSCRASCDEQKFACLQRQKPAMFAQMPLFVYRHFTGAVCTTSSDGRFALFSAPSTAAFSVASRLSNSSDILLRASSEPPPPRQSPVARTRFKTLIYLKGFGVGACGGHGFYEQIFDANEQVSRTATTPLEKRSALVLQSGKGRTLPSICSALTCPGRHHSPPGWGLFRPWLHRTNLWRRQTRL